MFCFIDCSSFVEKNTPNAFTEEVAHFNFLYGRRVITVLFLDEPIHMASVLVLFIFSPDILLKQSSMSKLAWSDFSEPSRKRVVSSAYWLMLHSVPFIFIPFIFLSFLIAFTKISAQRMKIYGERGQPCLTPRSRLKNIDSEMKDIPGLLLFVDFEKAFDTLEWSFVENVFKRYNSYKHSFEYLYRRFLSTQVVTVHNYNA